MTWGCLAAACYVQKWNYKDKNKLHTSRCFVLWQGFVITPKSHKGRVFLGTVLSGTVQWPCHLLHAPCCAWYWECSNSEDLAFMPSWKLYSRLWTNEINVCINLRVYVCMYYMWMHVCEMYINKNVDNQVYARTCVWCVHMCVCKLSYLCAYACGEVERDVFCNKNFICFLKIHYSSRCNETYYRV